MPIGKVLMKNDKGEFEEVVPSILTLEMLILSRLDGLKEELDIINSKLLTTEAKSKADKVAMLEDLNLEINEMFAGRIDYTVDRIQDLIQQKIDKLKENGNEKR